jgi:starch-binding outer membrane protein, SusD/RagB family
MKTLNYIKAGAILIAMLAIGSCNDDIMDYPDPNAKSEENFFKTPAEIEQGAFAIYSSFFHNNAFMWQLPEVFDGLANEFEGRPSSTGEVDIHTILRYEHTNTHPPTEKFWKLLYRMIMRSNLVLEKAKKYIETNGDDPIVSRCRGDAHFLRGWAYSQLAFHWGDVPLRTSYVVEGNGDLPRSPVKDIWEQAEADFKAAQTLLPEAWEAAFLGRATNGSATGFLGKLYLYNKRYAEAAAEFVKLEGKYSLLPGSQWDDNFGETNENNRESIFEIQCQNTAGTNQFASMLGDPEEAGNPGRQNAHAQLYSWTDWANWAFQPRRVLDFQYNDESGSPYVDPRAALTFYGGAIGDQEYCDNCPGGPKPFDFVSLGYWYRKVTNKENKANENNVQTGNNIRLMRYADVLLMRAECHILQGQVSEGIEFINQVRTRIGAFPYDKVYTQEQAFELLKRERQVELMGEMHRYNDIKRWGILKETMNIELQAMFGTPNVQDKHYLFPIPQKELDTNREFGPVENSWN